MERFKGPLAALLCLSLTGPSTPAWAETVPPADQTANLSPARQPYKSGQLQGDERILHALNRFTFGPRPGDLEAVRTMGLDKWFDQQLHPETIDEADLNARLAQFPAMQSSPQDLLFRLPSNAVIRQVADGKAPMPQNPALHVLYENELARVELRRQEKAQQAQQQASMTGNGASPTAGDAAGGQAAAPTPASMAMAAMIGNMMDDTGAAKTPAPAQTEQTGDMAMSSVQANPGQPAANEVQVTPSLIAEITALPPQRRVVRMASMSQPEFDAFRKALKPQQRAALNGGLTPFQREYVAALESPQRVVVDELAYQRLTRDIYSNAQLQEVMTDFWLNHFNVYLHKNEETPYYLVSFERDVIRPRALGKFEDLLEATAHSPAMLLYLDNATSMGPDSPAAERNMLRDARNPNAKRKAPEGLNENYARELMELHTLGVNGGYTQADVTQVARVLTGWTVDRPARGGEFKFDENRHEPGTKKVLGKKIKENGEQEGRELLHMLATRPATAQFLCRKLAIRFVGDDPPQSLMDRMAKSYLSSGGDIAKVLNTLFHSQEFWSTSAYRAKVKTPLEYVVSAARASNATTDNLQPLATALRDMGMTLYGSIPPTGYNWQSSTWVSTGALVNRMNFALMLAANKLPGIAVAWPEQAASWTGEQPVLLSDGSTQPAVVHDSAVTSIATPEAEEQRLETLLVPGGVSDSTRSAVLEQFQTQTSAQNTAPAMAMAIPAAAKPLNATQAAAAIARQDQVLAGLLLGSPEFQRR